MAKPFTRLLQRRTLPFCKGTGWGGGGGRRGCISSEISHSKQFSYTGIQSVCACLEVKCQLRKMSPTSRFSLSHWISLLLSRFFVRIFCSRLILINLPTSCLKKEVQNPWNPPLGTPLERIGTIILNVI